MLVLSIASYILTVEIECEQGDITFVVLTNKNTYRLTRTPYTGETENKKKHRIPIDKYKYFTTGM